LVFTGLLTNLRAPSSAVITGGCATFSSVLFELTMKYSSFDVFDTVITRSVLRPKDVFYLMQQRLEAQQADLPRCLRNCFWGARVWSEFMARRRSSSDDITLLNIYDTMVHLFGLDGVVKDYLMSLELSIESELLVPIDGAVELVAEARRSGSVVFISDMYLPETFIRGILERFGLFLPGDRLYVSGELGQSKGSGRLFLHVLEDLDIIPSQMLHCGDNPVSDCRAPRAVGIRLLDESNCLQSWLDWVRGYIAMFHHLNDIRRARLQIMRVPHV
jgi:predicted HAD superfamily hydrolase